MRMLTTFEAKNAFPRALKLSRKDVVIVTNRGKPVAAIEGLRGEEDLEDYLLERSPKFDHPSPRRARGSTSRDTRAPNGNGGACTLCRLQLR